MAKNSSDSDGIVEGCLFAVGLIALIFVIFAFLYASSK